MSQKDKPFEGGGDGEPVLPYSTEECGGAASSGGKKKVPTTLGGSAYPVTREGFVEGPFMCSECPKRFTRSDALKPHLLTVHNIGKSDWIKCPFENCEVKRISRDLRRHLINFHKVNPADMIPGASHYVGGTNHLHEKVRCSFGVCAKEFSTAGNLYRHIRNVHGVDPREVMEGIFNKRPPRKNVNVTIFPCVFSTCKIDFTERKSLRRHIRSVHRKDPELFVDEATPNWPKLEVEGVPKISRTTETENGGKIMSKKTSRSGVEGERTRNVPQGDEEGVKEEIPRDSTEEGEILMEEDFPLCILCCYPFNEELESVFEKLSESFHFCKFVCEMLPPEDLPKSLDKLAVCLGCRNLVICAMERKLGVEEVRMRRRFDGEEEMGILTEYCSELMKLGEVICAAEVECLKKKKYRSLAKKLREGALREMHGVQSRMMELEDASLKLTRGV